MQRARPRCHEIDHITRRAEIAAIAAERLRQRAHLKRHVRLGLIRIRVENGEAMRVVGHQPRIMRYADICQGGDGRAIAIHGENVIGDEQGMPMPAALGFQNGICVIHIVVTKDASRRGRKPAAGEDAGVCQLVNEDQIAISRERRNDAEIGQIAGAENARGLGMFQCGKPRLKSH